MLSRKLLVSGASVVVLTLSALGGAAGSASASAGVRPQTLFLGQLKNFASGLCLGISSGAIDGDAVQATCVHHNDQEWTAGDPVGNGFYRIYNKNNQCLGVSAGETHNGAQVVATPCLGGHDDQLWFYTNNVSPQCDYPFFGPIFNDKATNKVIGVAGGSTATGAPIVIFDFQGQCNNQYWSHTGT
jgi:hypothetical protein